MYAELCCWFRAAQLVQSSCPAPSPRPSMVGPENPFPIMLQACAHGSAMQERVHFSLDPNRSGMAFGANVTCSSKAGSVGTCCLLPPGLQSQSERLPVSLQMVVLTGFRGSRSLE